jgi:hypothetical protein
LKIENSLLDVERFLLPPRVRRAASRRFVTLAADSRRPRAVAFYLNWPGPAQWCVELGACLALAALAGACFYLFLIVF